MKIVGIVSEYNPIHLGHIYQMNTIREIMGDDTGIVCVMSGNCVQRGDFAIYDKWARAEAAVRSGADLVVELPVPYVISSAEYFAMGAVSMMESMGMVTHISFGSESGDIDELSLIADVLLSRDGEISGKMKNGRSYATACHEIIQQELGGECGEIIKEPNNILGIEYIKSIKKLLSNIVPLTLKRKGAGHDSFIEGEHFVSAAYIRELKKSHKDSTLYIPESAMRVFDEEEKAGRGPIYMESIEQAMMTLLRIMDKSYLEGTAAVSEGIENRLVSAITEGTTLGEIINLTKTRRYPESRVRRVILNACLGIKKSDKCETPPYIRVLAAGERGRSIIKEISKNSEVPVVTKPAKIKKLCDAAQRMFSLECRGTDLYVLAFSSASLRGMGREWRQNPRLI